MRREQKRRVWHGAKDSECGRRVRGDGSILEGERHEALASGLRRLAAAYAAGRLLCRPSQAAGNRRHPVFWLSAQSGVRLCGGRRPRVSEQRMRCHCSSRRWQRHRCGKVHSAVVPRRYAQEPAGADGCFRCHPVFSSADHRGKRQRGDAVCCDLPPREKDVYRPGGLPPIGRMLCSGSVEYTARLS